METRPANTIARERVEDLASRGEPDWLKAARLSAWESYLQVPMPNPRQEEWRKTTINELDPGSLTNLDVPPADGKEHPLPGVARSAFNTIAERAGFIFQSTNLPTYVSLSQAAASKGVIFCDLRQAITEHGKLIKPYLTRPATEAADGKFGLMNKALFNCGVFLYIPPNVEIAEPFISGLNIISKDNSAIFPRIIVIAGANSKVNLVQILESETEEAEPFCLAAGLVEVHAGDNAQVNYLEVQEFGREVFSIWRNRNEIGRDATFTALTTALGGKQTKADIITALNERGARSEVLGLVLGSANEHFNFNTVQEHNAPDTTSDINFRVALKDAAASIYQGVIKIDKPAQRTAAYQTNKNLLLGSEARADSIPRLEILADDVQCSHGATVGPVDQEQVFYLMSRGLPREQAEEFIVLGFFRQVLEQFPLPAAVEWVGGIISENIYPQRKG